MRPKPLQIGNLTIDPPTLLAPMSGYTQAPFRALCRRYHCGLVFTEVTSAKDIACRLRQGLRFLRTFPEERPVGAHIYGADVEVLVRAALLIQSLDRFDLIDINCGCPVPKVMKRSSGAALMHDPQKIHDMVQAVSQAVPLPVTIKTRLGLTRESANVSEVAHAAEEGGASAVIIHARFACDEHRGPADWEALKRIKAERAIPVIGNGGIREARHASEMIAQTGVDGVMVARAAIGDPWIFEEIHHLWSGEPYTPPSNTERRAVIAEHLRGLSRLIEMENQGRTPRQVTNEQIACRRFRGHLTRYLTGTPGLKDLRRALAEMEAIEAIMAAVDRILRQD
ncbi:MAG: tRNA-dihydrouridine synthase family protein [Anaerolineae bacterium]|jgi:tRNA-dihydrouridine synthase B|nr:tRNA-dihydrouridine synthase family protein [Anaerolineae bacterium]